MSTEHSLTDCLVDYLLEEKGQEIPDQVLEKAKECVLDYVAVTYAGAKANRDAMQRLLCGDNGNCSLIGYGKKTSSREAAFANAFNAHVLELDDGSRFGMIHLGAGILSAVLAAAQERNLTYSQVLRGIVLGYEAAVRVSLAMQPGHKQRGFHTSGTCGTIGAAVGAACAMGCGKKELKAVLSAAATSAAGLLEIQEDASTLKPYNLGHAAMAGLNAAYTGLAGFVGPEDILAGRRGMMRLLTDRMDPEPLTVRTDYYEIQRIYVKPYAACRHCHSAIEATLNLRQRHGVSPADIREIRIRTYELAVQGHDHKEIQGIASAKLSMPFSVAAAYVLGSAGMEAFTGQTLQNATISALMQKVSVIADDTLTAQSKKKRIAEVSILTDHDTFEEKIEYAKGDPENPLSREELLEKFYLLMQWAGCEQRCSQISKTILDI